MMGLGGPFVFAGFTGAAGVPFSTSAILRLPIAGERVQKAECSCSTCCTQHAPFQRRCSSIPPKQMVSLPQTTKTRLCLA